MTAVTAYSFAIIACVFLLTMTHFTVEELRRVKREKDYDDKAKAMAEAYRKKSVVANPGFTGELSKPPIDLSKPGPIGEITTGWSSPSTAMQFPSATMEISESGESWIRMHREFDGMGDWIPEKTRIETSREPVVEKIGSKWEVRFK